MPEAVGTGKRHDQDVELFWYLGLLWRYRVMIAALCTASLVVALVTTFRATRIYDASASFLAPLDQGALGQVAAGLPLTQAAGLTAAAQVPNREVLVAILKSRTMAVAVVERFRLRERNDRKSLELAIASLRSATEILILREGIVSVRVEDPDPALAAEIANFYLTELERMVAEYGRTDAGRQREYLTEQRAQAQRELAAAEEALRKFQERNHAIVLQDQIRSVIEAAARLRGEIVAGEVRLAMLRGFATETNPEVVMATRELEEKRRQLQRVQHGEAAATALGRPGRRDDIVVPFAKVAGLALELARLTRDVKVQETVVNILSEQVERARLTEARVATVVRVLDPAVPAERHVKPRLGQNLATAGGLSLFAGVFLALFLDYLKTTGSMRRETAP